MTDLLGAEFDSAMKLRDEGKYAEAIRVLEALITDRIDKRWRMVAVLCQLGNIYSFHLKEPAKGATYFLRATRLKPSSELSSLGLFHSLLNQGKVGEARKEMKRFMASYRSKEYELFLKEVSEGTGSPEKKD